MTSVPETPLSGHIARKIGLSPDQPLTDEALSRWQLDKLNETIDYARSDSPFYRRWFDPVLRQPLIDLSDLNRYPFTTADDLRADPMRFLCVSQDRIARVTTLQTSGTTSSPKRIFFTESDLESTIDFFHHGMSTLVKPGQRVLILLPGSLYASVGDLLVKGLERMNVQGFVHWPVTDPESSINSIIEYNIDCLVGIPVQVLSLVRHPRGRAAGKTIESLLLSTDYVPESVVAEIRRTWKCDVFQHYGMTEMGYGGGVECRAVDGYHLREADLYFEIIDPETGHTLPDGQQGEVVFTTLTRKGMPLIRYRTGDLACFIPGSCACKSPLRRMGYVIGRIGDIVALKEGSRLSISDLDEVLFSVDGVINYQVKIKRTNNLDRLEISIYTGTGNPNDICRRVGKALLHAPRLNPLFERQIVVLDPVLSAKENWVSSATAKRRIIDQRSDADF